MPPKKKCLPKVLQQHQPENEEEAEGKAPRMQRWNKRKALTMEDLDIEFPNVIVIVAKKFSGKTNLILDMINPDEFENTFIITGTSHIGRLDSLVESEDNVLNCISDEFIERLEEFQIENDNPPCLLIFDDFIGTGNDPKKLRKISKLASTGRHFNISIVFSSQDLTSIPIMMRRNAEYMFFGNNFQNVIESIAKAFGTMSLPTKDLQAKMNKIVRNKNFEFLFFDDRNQRFEVFRAEKKF